MSRLDPDSMVPNDIVSSNTAPLGGDVGGGGGSPPIGGNLRSPGGGAPQIPVQQTLIQVKGAANTINSRFTKQPQQYDGYDTYKNDENIHIYHYVCCCVFSIILALSGRVFVLCFFLFFFPAFESLGVWVFLMFIL